MPSIEHLQPNTPLSSTPPTKSPPANPPIANSTGSTTTDAATLPDELPYPLIYFPGMKKLIGDALSEGIYVSETMRDGGIDGGMGGGGLGGEGGVVASREELREMAMVKGMQGEANNIGESLKDLKGLLTGLPTFQPTYTPLSTARSTNVDDVLHANIYFPNVRPFEK